MNFFQEVKPDVRVCFGGLQNSNHDCFNKLLCFKAL